MVGRGNNTNGTTVRDLLMHLQFSISLQFSMSTPGVEVGKATRMGLRVTLTAPGLGGIGMRRDVDTKRGLLTETQT